MIWAANLADIESMLSDNRDVKYLLCLLDVYSKCVWVKPLTNNKVNLNLV